MEKTFSWLQLSDLHIYDSTKWNLMLNGYRELAKIVKPNFIVATGDFRHKIRNSRYDDAIEFLNEIVNIFGVSKSDFFLVPGNHDVNDYAFRKECLRTIRSEIERNPDVYCDYMLNDKKDLRQAFTEYCEFIKLFYNEEISDERVKTPSDIIHFKWNNLLNIVILNTALISEGNEDEQQIVDIKTLSKIKNNNLPTIVLSHHDIYSIVPSQIDLLVRILNNLNTKVYLCGDKHLLQKEELQNFDLPNITIPIFVCGKSAVENGDLYSDVSVIEYKTNNDGNVYVQVYRYGNKGFVKSNDFYYDIDKQFNFPMFNNYSELTKPTKFKKKPPSKKEKPLSIWLPDAELANGKQTRFNSFTKTEMASKFLDLNKDYLGIVSVKGIGKTFLLQVKRVKSSRRYYCLPKYTKPSLQNNWATERISFDTYHRLKTEETYDNLVIMWKMAIKCYVINHLKNEINEKLIEEFINKNIISDEIYSLFINGNTESLESIISNIISIDKWDLIISECSTKISNLCRIILRDRRKRDPNSKRIAIFIDKTDQSIKQTNAEPPADCVV